MLSNGHIEFKKDLRETDGLSLRYDFEISGLSRICCGGRVFCLAICHDIDTLEKVILRCIKNRIGYYIIGSLTNTLISDRFHNEVFIKLGKSFKYIKKEGRDIVHAGAATYLQRLVISCAKMDLDLSSMAGIPGTLGGALVCNSGPKNDEISNYLYGLQALEIDNEKLEHRSYLRDEVHFKYRDMQKTREIIVTSVMLKIPVNHIDILGAIRENIKEKRKNQPLSTKNLGCFFKNPKDGSAGMLIDKAGLKGLRYGDAEVSEKHANFLENLGSASYDDIIGLFRIVRQHVFKKYKTMLEPEVRIIE